LTGAWLGFPFPPPIPFAFYFAVPTFFSFLLTAKVPSASWVCPSHRTTLFSLFFSSFQPSHNKFAEQIVFVNWKQIFSPLAAQKSQRSCIPTSPYMDFFSLFLSFLPILSDSPSSPPDLTSRGCLPKMPESGHHSRFSTLAGTRELPFFSSPLLLVTTQFHRDSFAYEIYEPSSAFPSRVKPLGPSPPFFPPCPPPLNWPVVCPRIQLHADLAFPCDPTVPVRPEFRVRPPPPPLFFIPSINPRHFLNNNCSNQRRPILPRSRWAPVFSPTFFFQNALFEVLSLLEGLIGTAPSPPNVAPPLCILVLFFPLPLSFWRELTWFALKAYRTGQCSDQYSKLPLLPSIRSFSNSPRGDCLFTLRLHDRLTRSCENPDCLPPPLLSHPTQPPPVPTVQVRS